MGLLQKFDIDIHNTIQQAKLVRELVSWIRVCFKRAALLLVGIFTRNASSLVTEII